MKKISTLLILVLYFVVLKAEQNYTVIVSLDGFRHDYPHMYNTPTLDKISEKGVSAVMKPSYPASTFPNHYTLATGLVPDHHGIVNNKFWVEEKGKEFTMGDTEMRYNPEYFGGEPIWITAQNQGLITGNLYWVGSDVAIKGSYPTYYKMYNAKPRLTFEQRVDTVVAWLNKPAELRPRLIMMYIEEPDGAGHRSGPDSDEVGSVVEYLDSLMGSMIDKISQLPISDKVNVIITSDHGMTRIDNEKRFVKSDDIIKPHWYKRMVGTNPTSIFTNDGYKDSVINVVNKHPHIKAYSRESMPLHLNYGTNPRLGDVIIVPDCGWHFDTKPKGVEGAHGYDPQDMDMQVIFRAYGPDFKQGYASGKFDNVDIYLLLAKLLGIVPAAVDGKFERIESMLN